MLRTVLPRITAASASAALVSALSMAFAASTVAILEDWDIKYSGCL